MGTGEGSGGGSVRVVVALPREMPPGSLVTLESLTVAGSAVPGFPATVTVAGPGEPLSLRAPLQLDAPCDGSQPCVTPAGVLYVPSGGDLPGLAAFDCNGATAPISEATLKAAAAGCWSCAAWAPAQAQAAYATAASRPLLILGGSGGLCAADGETGARIWEAEPTAFACIGGLAVVGSGAERVVAVSSKYSLKVHILSPFDGTSLAFHRVRAPGFLAAAASLGGGGSGAFYGAHGEVFASNLIRRCVDCGGIQTLLPPPVAPLPAPLPLQVRCHGGSQPRAR